MGDQGAFPDRGIDPASIDRIGAQAGGATVLERPASAIRGGGYGSFTGGWNPLTGERAAQIGVRSSLDSLSRDTVLAHENAHLIDWIAGAIPTKGLDKELRGVYNTLNTGQERTRRLTGPEHMGYPRQEVPGELMAEAIRAYLQNPNYLKSVAPKTAMAIRNAVNSNPELNRWVQFNSLAGLGLAAQPAAEQ
jgi:hypothetical protein